MIRNVLAAAGFAVLAATFVQGCAPAPLAGEWDCDTASTTKYSAPVGSPDYDGSGSYVISVVETQTGLTETRVTGSSGAPCPLHAIVAADNMSAKFDANQTCLNSVGNHVTFTEGSMQVANGRITGVRNFTVAGKTAQGADLMGSGTATFACTRHVN